MIKSGRNVALTLHEATERNSDKFGVWPVHVWKRTKVAQHFKIRVRMQRTISHNRMEVFSAGDCNFH